MTKGPNPFADLVRQLLDASSSGLSHGVVAWPANPFPKGVRPGCGTERILLALQAAHPKWLECHELMRIAGVSRGAVSWGTRYLAQHGMVRSVPSFRHPQYFRYGLTKKDRDDAP